MKRIFVFVGVISLVLGFWGGDTLIAQCVDSVIVSSNGEAYPGDLGIHVPVYGRVCGREIGENIENLDAFSFALEYDPTKLVCKEIIYEVTDPNYSSFYDVIPSPDFFAPYIDTTLGYATLGLTFKFVGTPDVPPGRYRMFDLVFDVKGGATPGKTDLDVKDGLSSPPVSNVFTYLTTNVYPEKVDGKFTILGEAFGAIEGDVTDAETSDSISGALVEADGHSSWTNEDGHYLIENVPVGIYNMTVTALGYLTGYQSGVEVSSGETTVVNFLLAPGECVNQLLGAQIEGGGGGSDFVYSVTAVNCVPLEAYTVSISYDPSLIHVTSVDTLGTATGIISPLSFTYHISTCLRKEWVTAECVVSDDHTKSITPGINPLFNIHLSANPAPLDTIPLVFETYPEFQCPPCYPTENAFFYGDSTYYPELVNGYFVLLPPFVRGDYNGDGTIMMADALSLLLWIFKQPGGYDTQCWDAADYNDDGEIQVNDAFTLLLWLFEQPGGVPPAMPYPECGPDPTQSDDFGCEWHEACMNPDGRRVAGMKIVPQNVEVVKNRVNFGEQFSTSDGKIKLPLYISNAEGLIGFEINIKYNPSRLGVRWESESEVKNMDFFIPLVDNDRGEIKIGCIPSLDMSRRITPGRHLVGSLLVEVEPKVQDGNNEIPLKIAYAVLYGNGANILPVEWIDGVIKPGAELPKQFSLDQNYPNPFNSSTLVRFSLPKETHTLLEIYNIMGEKVIVLLDQKQKAGYHSVVWDGQDQNGSQVSSGVYFCRLSTSVFTSVKKMVLLR